MILDFYTNVGRRSLHIVQSESRGDFVPWNPDISLTPQPPSCYPQFGDEISVPGNVGWLDWTGSVAFRASSRGCWGVSREK